jgi:hypothetical protein
VTVTWVAFSAVTVKVDEPPAEIEDGCAPIVTIGVPLGPVPVAPTDTVVLAVTLPLVPVAVAV